MADDEVKLVKNKRAKAKVWEHFKFRQIAGTINENIAVCTVCNADVKYAGGTSNFTSHIRRHNPNLDAGSFIF